MSHRRWCRIAPAILLVALPVRAPRAQPCAGPSAQPRAPVLVLCGTVRDEGERPLAGITVADELDEVAARTDSAGRFRLELPARASGVLVAVRALGWAPAYRTFTARGDTVVTWELTLRSVQRLAARTVTATGLPPEFAAPRFEELLARRARGLGHFLIGDDLRMAGSLAGAIGRVPGTEVLADARGGFRRLALARCGKGTEGAFQTGRVGVFLNGRDETQRVGLARDTNEARVRDAGGVTAPRATRVIPLATAEEVLSEFGVAELAAIEVYRGRGEIPGVFANPDYCAVIALWTR